MKVVGPARYGKCKKFHEMIQSVDGAMENFSLQRKTGRKNKQTEQNQTKTGKKISNLGFYEWKR